MMVAVNYSLVVEYSKMQLHKSIANLIRLGFVSENFLNNCLNKFFFIQYTWEVCATCCWRKSVDNICGGIGGAEYTSKVNVEFPAAVGDLDKVVEELLYIEVPMVVLTYWVEYRFKFWFEENCIVAVSSPIIWIF